MICRKSWFQKTSALAYYTLNIMQHGQSTMEEERYIKLSKEIGTVQAWPWNLIQLYENGHNGQKKDTSSSRFDAYEAVYPVWSIGTYFFGHLR